MKEEKEKKFPFTTEEKLLNGKIAKRKERGGGIEGENGRKGGHLLLILTTKFKTMGSSSVSTLMPWYMYLIH